MGYILILIIIVSIWIIRNKFVDHNRDCDIKNLTEWAGESLRDGHTREEIYTNLKGYLRDKKYSEFVINKVIILLLYALIKQLRNDGWSWEKIQQVLQTDGYDKFYISRAIEYLKENG